jgi:hypothetical protein
MAIREGGDVECLRALDLVVVARLHVIGKLARIDVGAGERRDADNGDHVELGDVFGACWWLRVLRDRRAARSHQGQCRGDCAG